MLVSHLHQFIFTKTLKTGSTSVESYFEPYCMPNGEWVRTHRRDEYESATGIIGFRGPEAEARTRRWWNHMPAQQIRAQLGHDHWERYFKFCVVRNPYDKAISAYFFFNAAQAGMNLPAELDHRKEFEQWLESGELPIDQQIFTIDGRLAVDKVLRYETLAQDLEAICIQLGVPWSPQGLPRFKAGYRPAGMTPERLFTPRARRLVEAAYPFEFEHFGYRFPDSRAA